MEDKELVLYHLFQVTDLFSSNYGYSQVLLQKYRETMKNEAWLFNSSNINYQIIRISFNSANDYENDKDRIDKYLEYFRVISNKNDLKFLDIHICNEKHDAKNEPYDYININENYYDGIDLSKMYPELYNIIHTVEDPNKEIENIASRMRKNFKANMKSKPFLKRHKYLVTDIVTIICILIYICSLFLKYKYKDTTSIFVVLGADYKTFTLGMNQFYRLFTYAFVHNDIIHLFCNLYSLNILGRYIEGKLGHLKYSLILMFSILCGSLTQGILCDNSICIGLSAGIYGIMVVFFVDALQTKILNLHSLIPTISINIFLNFLSTVAWTSHLGGAIGGFVMFFFLQEYKNPARIVLIFVLLLCLGYKYVTINSINSFYGGTDMQILKIYNDFGFKNYSSKLLIKLFEAYERLGG